MSGSGQEQKPIFLLLLFLASKRDKALTGHNINLYMYHKSANNTTNKNTNKQKHLYQATEKKRKTNIGTSHL